MLNKVYLLQSKLVLVLSSCLRVMLNKVYLLPVLSYINGIIAFESNVKQGISLTNHAKHTKPDRFESNVKQGISLTRFYNHK